MAISSTLCRFQIELSDIDRGVYESLDCALPVTPPRTASGWS